MRERQSQGPDLPQLLVQYSIALAAVKCQTSRQGAWKVFWQRTSERVFHLADKTRRVATTPPLLWLEFRSMPPKERRNCTQSPPVNDSPVPRSGAGSSAVPCVAFLITSLSFSGEVLLLGSGKGNVRVPAPPPPVDACTSFYPSSLQSCPAM
jgi:hypothetical protein